jgi:Na+-transporting NADH:ubiquinone oxidoreductase subunit NqrD
VINSRFLGAQTTKQLGPYLVIFANYSAMNQASSAALPSNTLNQLIQGLGFGIGYSPWRQTARH